MARKEFLLIAIATLITIILWAVLDIIHSRVKTEVPPRWQEASEEIDPNFDLGVLQNK